MGLHLHGLVALLLPSLGDGLPLGVESHSTLSVEVGGSPHGLLVTGEGEHGQGDGDWEVDTNLSSLDFVNEFSGVSSGSGKDSCTVSVRVIVDKLDGVLNSVGSVNDHNW